MKWALSGMSSWASKLIDKRGKSTEAAVASSTKMESRTGAISLAKSSMYRKGTSRKDVLDCAPDTASKAETKEEDEFWDADEGQMHEAKVAAEDKEGWDGWDAEGKDEELNWADSPKEKTVHASIKTTSSYKGVPTATTTEDDFWGEPAQTTVHYQSTAISEMRSREEDDWFSEEWSRSSTITSATKEKSKLSASPLRKQPQSGQAAAPLAPADDWGDDEW